MRYFRIFIIGTIALLGSYCISAGAGTAQSRLTGNFEGGDTLGTFVYNDNSNGLSISYYSPSLKKNLSYSVSKFDECSSMAMYRIPNTRQIAIDGSCSSQGGQIFKYVYEWKDTFSNWCLIREITGEKADVTSGTVVPSEQVGRVANCYTIGAAGPYKYESVTEVNQDISNELDEFRVAIGNKSALNAYLNSLPSYSVLELASHINSENVRNINDLVYFLSENGRSYDAIPVLETIVNKFPDRIVVKLNLADAYWDNDFKEQASAMYKEYYDEATSRGFKSKIPKRVSERIAK
jgi:hypothetical protein